MPTSAPEVKVAATRGYGARIVRCEPTEAARVATAERLIADETIDHGHGDREARRFITALADVLGVSQTFVMPAYEDVWYYLWKERRLPVNVDPLQSRLEDEEERDRGVFIIDLG